MRHLYAAMAVLCLFSISACAEFENPNESDPNIGPFVQSDSLSESIKVQVQPSSAPEKYMVYFSWPKINPHNRIRIRKDRTLSVVPASQTTFSHEVDHDQTATYIFEVLNSSSLVEKSIAKSVIIPRDFVVRPGQSEFTSDQRINVKRLFLERDISLRTNGHRVEIITEELHSDHGVIETFAEGSRASNSQDGVNGGELLLRADRAIGSLKVLMRGQNGGDGEKGKPFTTRAADGRPPEPGIMECETRFPRGDFSHSLLNLANTQIESQLFACRCSEFGADGTSGATGAKGRPGTRAGNGGDSGILKVEIQDGSGFLLQADALPGSAGVPSPGGDGQPGGLGQGYKTRCSGKPGSNGARGPRGDDGPNGVAGKSGSICVFIASEGKNDCY